VRVTRSCAWRCNLMQVVRMSAVLRRLLETARVTRSSLDRSGTSRTTSNLTNPYILLAS
jgi:hypothetical protein